MILRSFFDYGLSCFLLTFATGCGGGVEARSDDGGATPGEQGVTLANGGLVRLGGSFTGVAITPVDATAFIRTTVGGEAGVASELLVMISDKPGMCETSASTPNQTSVRLQAYSGGISFKAGDSFIIDSSNHGPGTAKANVSRMNATCDQQQSWQIAGGSVVITNVDASTVSGTFSITFSNFAPVSDQGTLEGSFEIPLCAHDLIGECRP